MSERYRIIDNPLGRFVLIRRTDGSLASTWLSDSTASELDDAAADPSMDDDLAARLTRYFGGERVDFDDVPTPPGGEFMRRCWEACRAIPYGDTRSYGQLAKLAGSGPAGARAAGQAMRHNPLPVIVPCHRVLARDGRLHGFAGSRAPGGPQLTLKRGLLDLESRPLLAGCG